MKDVIKFLKEEDTDFRGRVFSDLVGADDSQLEQSHDFIQWMFPSDVKSNHSYAAPVLTPEQIEQMKTDPAVHNALRAGLIRMLVFYTSEWWITPHNHNFKRITRILRCLWLAGLESEYNSFQTALDRCYEKHGGVIEEKTYQFWKHAKDSEYFT